MKSQYKTHQRDEMIDCIRQMPRGHFTAADLADRLKSQGSSIGTTTVYRHLERLCEEGILIRHYIDENTPVCYEYTGHAGTESCWHCKCTECGRLIHLHCDELEAIQSHLLEHHGFTLNPMRTVFYGLCGDCSSAEIKE